MKAATTKTAKPELRPLIERHGLLILRLTIGAVFVWFGLLKFLPASAAEELATDTISWLSCGQVKGNVALPSLGILECGIGLSVLFNKGMNITIPVLYLHMAGTMLPLLIFPEKTWLSPFIPTLAGQYIIKNTAFIASGILLGAVARGSKLITHPGIAKAAKSAERKKISGQHF